MLGREEYVRDVTASNPYHRKTPLELNHCFAQLPLLSSDIVSRKTENGKQPADDPIFRKLGILSQLQLIDHSNRNFLGLYLFNFAIHYGCMHQTLLGRL